MRNHKKEVAEFLEDSLKEWAFEDRSVGIWSIPEQQIKIIENIIEQLKDSPNEYDKDFGDDKICKCGHAYYRHFDTYEDMYSCGCKYCGCFEFEEENRVEE